MQPQKEGMKSSQAWIEVRTLVACPHCNETHSLGDTYPNDDIPVVCEKCEKIFLMKAVTDD